MGKIVKYCAACDESFAEKFAFCPNCGKSVQAFEMNPLGGTESVVEKVNVGAANGSGSYKAGTIAPVVVPEIIAEDAPLKVSEPAPVVVPVEKTPVAAVDAEKNPIELKVNQTAELPAPVKETKVFAAAASNGNGSAAASQTSNDGYRTVESQKYQNAGSFNVTVIEEQNVGRRNALLLGSLLFILTLGAGTFVYSLFNSDLSIAAIGDESGLSMPITDEVPMAVEEEAPKPKANKDAGGGGGGGREAKTETSQGRLATQTEKPLIAPDVSIVQKNFELKQPVASTQGKMQIKPTERPYGDPNSRSTLSSNGMGVGGGQGSGIGTGQGSGRGTGAGSGIGSGFGSGEGDGIGSGRGSGVQNNVGTPPAPPPAPKKPEPVGVTEKVKILAKPRASYTDAARQNQVTGTVRLRVTFTASGQVGSVAPVSGLPYGLTEQAIAAAKGIKFEPAKRNGVATAQTSIVEYSFTIY